MTWKVNMDDSFIKGSFARSKAGRDAGNIYIVIGADADFVYLSDGRHKSVDNPKRKKRKHLQPVKERAETVMSRLNSGMPVRDEDVKRDIKIYNSGRQ